MAEPQAVVTSKPWWESITVWGAGIGILGTVLGFVNIVITPDQQAALAEGAAQVAAGIGAKDWGSILSGVTALVGLVMSIVGRKQADQPVHFVQPFTVAAPPAVQVKL
jgi:hypothetical protein